MSSYDDMARDAFGDTELAREAARRLEEAHRAEREEQLEDESGERFGFGVCATGRCVEPCGEHGGCARAGRRSRGR